MKDFAEAEFPASPDGLLKIMMTRKNYCTKEGFGTAPSVYPVTIVPSRYQGSYEGGTWICFPVRTEKLSKGQWCDWEGDDIDCMIWWDRASREGWPIGRGASPDLAYQNLLERVAGKAGINLQDWIAEPTWDRDELRRRDGEDHP